jgi:hypothetical protein
MLQINAEYALGADSLNIIVYHRTKGNRVWQAEAFLGDPKQALEYIVDRGIKGTGLRDVRTVVGKIEELHRAIDSIKLDRESLGQPAPPEPLSGSAKQPLRTSISPKRKRKIGRA